MDTISFQHLAPSLRLFHGPESLGQLGRELDRVNSKRAVIFCGASLARQDMGRDTARDALLDVVRELQVFSGFCYTQFADTYQEANGLLNADRTPKIPLERIAKATSRSRTWIPGGV